MSVPFLDYIPCDLIRYEHNLLPAWRAAEQGNLQDLRAWMASAQWVSYWPIFHLPNPSPAPPFAEPKNWYGYAFFHSAQALWPQFVARYGPEDPLGEQLILKLEETNEQNFWTFCADHLSLFFGIRASQTLQIFLFDCLFNTFCCQLPDTAMADSRVIGNEEVDLWREYVARNAQVEALWKGFKQPVLHPVERYQRTGWKRLTTEEPADPASMDEQDYAWALMGKFLPPAETARLLQAHPDNERPLLYSILDGCLRDSGWLDEQNPAKRWPLSPELAKQVRSHFSAICPWASDKEIIGEGWNPSQGQDVLLPFEDEQKTQAVLRAVGAYWNEQHHQVFQQQVDVYQQALQFMEREILSRFHFAVEHGWGMLQRGPQ